MGEASFRWQGCQSGASTSRLYIPGSDEGSIPRSHDSANLLFGDSAPAGCCVGKFPSRLSFILGAHGFHPVDLELNMFHFATASSSDTGEDVANSSQCASVSLPSIAAWAEYITSTLRTGRSRCERRRATSKSICMSICLLQCRILFPLRRRYFQLCYPHNSSSPARRSFGSLKTYTYTIPINLATCRMCYFTFHEYSHTYTVWPTWPLRLPRLDWSGVNIPTWTNTAHPACCIVPVSRAVGGHQDDCRTGGLQDAGSLPDR